MSRMFRCLACGGDRFKGVADLGSTPVLNGVMFDSRESARAAALGRLDLVACLDCGHAANVAFDSDLIDYDAAYDNSLHFSPTFQTYAEQLAQRLVETYELRGRRIVEIGSGKGDFLESIVQLSGGVGFGYDPSSSADRNIQNVTQIKDYYRPGQDVEPYDLLVCRHVLEHLENPEQILRSLTAAATAHAIHYFEVPAAEFDFGSTGMWDFIYPHVSYFSQQSLYALLRRCGFEIVASGRSFSGQFQWAEVQVGPAGSAVFDPTAHLLLLEDFAERHARVARRWRAELRDRAAAGQRTALWGAGSKGVSFLNAVDPDAMLLSVVDLNPRKWHRFLPGTGHQVIPPESLAGTGVTKVLITNLAYQQEIITQLEDLGIVADVAAV